MTLARHAICASVAQPGRSSRAEEVLGEQVHDELAEHDQGDGSGSDSYNLGLSFVYGASDGAAC